MKKLFPLWLLSLWGCHPKSHNLPKPVQSFSFEAQPLSNLSPLNSIVTSFQGLSISSDLNSTVFFFQKGVSWTLNGKNLAPIQSPDQDGYLVSSKIKWKIQPTSISYVKDQKEIEYPVTDNFSSAKMIFANETNLILVNPTITLFKLENQDLKSQKVTLNLQFQEEILGVCPKHIDPQLGMIIYTNQRFIYLEKNQINFTYPLQISNLNSGETLEYFTYAADLEFPLYHPSRVHFLNQGYIFTGQSIYGINFQSYQAFIKESSTDNGLWGQKISPYLADNCYTCHQNFKIRSSVWNIRQQMHDLVLSGSMPPGDWTIYHPLNENEKATFLNNLMEKSWD